MNKPARQRSYVVTARDDRGVVREGRSTLGLSNTVNAVLNAFHNGASRVTVGTVYGGEVRESYEFRSANEVPHVN